MSKLNSDKLIPKKPPNKYQTVKCSLKSIITCTSNADIIHDAIMRTHELIIHSYQFLRLWILNKYHDKVDIPEITPEVIKMAFLTLSKENIGVSKIKGNNLIIFEELTNFFESTYKLLNFENKIDSKYLSQILNYTSIDICTNIENNVKMHFIKYVKRFVNSSFKMHNNEIMEKQEKGTKTAMRKELNKDLYDIKEDLLNKTLKSKLCYHDWINKHKMHIFPEDCIHSYSIDIQHRPQKYIKCMIYMCLEIEKIGTKSFQFFPLRTNMIPKYIPIDTKSLIELLVKVDKAELFKDIEGVKEEVWGNYFNTENKIFKQKHYKFDYKISTDGMAVSIQLIHENYVENNKNKKMNMKNKKTELQIVCKNMTQEEKEKYKEKLKENQKKEQLVFKLKNKEIKDAMSKAFKQLSKDEQKNKLKEIKKKRETIIKNKYIEFPYLEDLNEKQIKHLNDVNWVVVDPGKRDLLYMKDKNGKKLVYSNRQHVTKTKRLKYQEYSKYYKDENNITEQEAKLAEHSAKTCNYNKFIEYIKMKNQINKILLIKYQNEIFRKYKWFGYINRKRAETDLLRNIKTTFGNDCILIMGDWSEKLSINRLKYMSTPNIGLKRKLAEHILIYNLDEFRTSCLNHMTEEKSANLILPDKTGIEREIHSILTYKTKSTRMGCINRDENAVKNMEKIVRYFIKYRERPLKYRRSYIFSDTPIKDNNPEETSASLKESKKFQRILKIQENN